jgi:hypothetical protein
VKSATILFIHVRFFSARGQELAPPNLSSASFFFNLMSENPDINRNV